MVRAFGCVSLTTVGYLSLLLSFAALGTFVYALAAQSAGAGIIGAGMVVLMVAAGAGSAPLQQKRADFTTVVSRSSVRTSGRDRPAASRSTGISRPIPVCEPTANSC
nr:hypothetical protein CPGR_00790 [Mycolicibacterium malmesburyense]